MKRKNKARSAKKMLPVSSEPHNTVQMHSSRTQKHQAHTNAVLRKLRQNTEHLDILMELARAGAPSAGGQ
jgi:hypothetical protein